MHQLKEPAPTATAQQWWRALFVGAKQERGAADRGYILYPMINPRGPQQNPESKKKGGFGDVSSYRIPKQWPWGTFELIPQGGSVWLFYRAPRVGRID